MAALNPALLRQLAALAAKRGPDAIRWMALVAPYVREPENRERFRTLTQRWTDARSARTPDARLAQQIAALVEHATEALDDAATDAERDRARGWLRRAKALDRSRTLLLGIAGTSRADAARRRQAVDRLTPEIERLRGEVLEAMLDLGHGGAPGSAAGQEAPAAHEPPAGG